MSVPRIQSLPLLRREDIGAGYHVLTFAAAEPLHAGAGQFAMVRGEGWGQAPLLPRPMSLLRAGKEPAILLKVVGEGTRRMAQAAVGERYTFHAPLGRRWQPAAGAAAAVGGGRGGGGAAAVPG